MPAIIEHNFLSIILEVFNREYPDNNCVIVFVHGLYDTESGAWGCTEWAEDTGQCLVSIDAKLPLAHFAEIIAHELAHVVAGHDAEHGKKWEAIFNNIHEVYCREMGYK